MKRKTVSILLAALLALSLFGCGSKSAPRDNSSGAATSAPVMPTESAKSENGYWAADTAMEAEAPGAPMAEPSPAPQRQNGSTQSNLPEGVKMIYRAHLDLETTEFDKAAEDIRTLTQSLGGYFEDQSMSNYSSGYRKADYTVRVPADRFEDFLRQIGSLCTVTYQTQSAEDVSEYYYDTASRLETAKIKLDRLQDLLARAELMEDIITLENAISDTEYQIESLSGTLRHYDALVDYATIYVNLAEVYRISEPESAPLTFGERMGSAFRDGLREFGDSLENFAVYLAYNWLTLLVLLAIVVVAIRLIWRGRRRRARKAASVYQTPPAAPAEPPRQDGEQK